MVRWQIGCWMAVVLAGVIGTLADRVWALELTVNESVGDGVLSGVSNGTASAETVVTNMAGGGLFRWADANGDNTADDPVSAGLYLKGRELTRTTDSIGIGLDLFDGAINGVLDGRTNGVLAGVIKTTRAGDTGSILITNAASVYIHTLDTRSTANYVNGGNISLLDVGDIVVTNLIACGGSSATFTPGAITVRQTGGLTADLVSDALPSGTARSPQALQLAGDGSGVCTLGSLRHVGATAGDVTIENYEGIRIGSGGIDARVYNHTPCSLYIRNVGTGGVHVAGDVLTYNPGSGSGVKTVRLCITNIAGSVSVGNIDMHTVDWGAGDVQQNITLEGLTIAAVGHVQVGDITAYHGSARNAFAYSGGHIAITSATGRVTVGSLDARTARPTSTSYGGNVSLTAHGDLAIAGDSIDLSAAYGPANHGRLTLTTTPGSRGRIFVGSTTNAVLDLNGILTGTFDSAVGHTALAGTLANFDVTSTGGSGGALDPFITTQTKLRAPTGQRIFYCHEPGGLNDALGGYAYRVADLNGAAGAGGVLVKDVPLSGTVFRFQ